MLRYRLQCETGVREFNQSSAGHCSGSSGSSGGASGPEDSAGPPPSLPALEAHLSAVVGWFTRNLAYLSSSSPSAAAALVDGVSPSASAAAAVREYESLFYEYRADLQSRCVGASPALMALLLARMQWKTIVEAAAAEASMLPPPPPAAAAATAAGASSGRNGNNASSGTGGGRSNNSSSSTAATGFTPALLPQRAVRA